MRVPSSHSNRGRTVWPEGGRSSQGAALGFPPAFACCVGFQGFGQGFEQEEGAAQWWQHRQGQYMARLAATVEMLQNHESGSPWLLNNTNTLEKTIFLAIHFFLCMGST